MDPFKILISVEVVINLKSNKSNENMLLDTGISINKGKCKSDKDQA